MQTSRKILLGLIISTMAATKALAGGFAAEKNHYVLSQDDRFVAHISTSLQPRADQEAGNNCYRATRKAKPQRLFRWASGDANEETTFCITNGNVVSDYYSYQRAGFGSASSSFTLRFDFANSKVTATGKEGQDRPTTAGLHDRFNVEFALRLWVRQLARQQTLEKGRTIAFDYADKQANKTYSFVIGDQEAIDTAFGPITARRIDFTNTEERVTFWLDPATGFRIVRFERVRDGKLYTMVAAPKGYTPE